MASGLPFTATHHLDDQGSGHVQNFLARRAGLSSQVERFRLAGQAPAAPLDTARTTRNLLERSEHCD